MHDQRAQLSVLDFTKSVVACAQDVVFLLVLGEDQSPLLDVDLFAVPFCGFDFQILERLVHVGVPQAPAGRWRLENLRRKVEHAYLFCQS